MLVINERIAIPDDELDFAFARSGGPGGQNVNKISSKAILRWRPAASSALPADVKARILARLQGRLTTEGDLLITSQQYRDQPRNMENCREKLRELLLAALHVPKTRRPTKPTKGSKMRRVEHKRHGAKRREGRRVPRDD